MGNVRTSAKAVIERGGRYLVTRYEVGAGDTERGGAARAWCTFPGGGQARGEDLHEALRRELREELGIEGAQLRIGPLRFVRECLADRHPGPGLEPGFHQVELYFECELDGEPPGGAMPDPWQVGFDWRTPGELAELNFYPRGMSALLPCRADPGKGIAYLGAVP